MARMLARLEALESQLKAQLLLGFRDTHGRSASELLNALTHACDDLYREKERITNCARNASRRLVTTAPVPSIAAAAAAPSAEPKKAQQVLS
jgi:hypothetical protein